jgi:hypothetical protein
MKKLLKTINEKLLSRQKKESFSVFTEVDNEKIAERAHQLWLARGGNHGNDWQDWLSAEQELRIQN